MQLQTTDEPVDPGSRGAKTRPEILRSRQDSEAAPQWGLLPIGHLREALASSGRRLCDDRPRAPLEIGKETTGRPVREAVPAGLKDLEEENILTPWGITPIWSVGMGIFSPSPMDFIAARGGMSLDGLWPFGGQPDPCLTAVTFVSVFYALLAVGRSRFFVRKDRAPWWLWLDPAVLSSNAYDKASISSMQLLWFTLIVFYSAMVHLFDVERLAVLSPDILPLPGVPGASKIASGVITSFRSRLSLENWN